jgi:DNA-binding NarL/FixJ family response regulator
MPPLRVFHIDDSPACLRLVELWLAAYSDLEHVGCLQSIDDGLEGLVRAAPDVVLLDTLGTTGDVDVAARVRAAAPQARLVLYSGYIGIAPAATLEIGADAHLRKEPSDQSLVALLRSLRETPARGGRFSARQAPAALAYRRTG